MSLPRLGNTGVSSLIKSASTLANQLNTYKDTVQQIEFENNPSDAQLQTYLSYLQGRTNNLNATGNITDATKALNMQQQMRSAIAKNTSFSIQNESIQIMSGNAAPQDKLNYIASAYQRAVSVGDLTLAQSLESQAYSLSQQMQYQAQVASEAHVALAKANNDAMKAGYSDAIAQIKDQISSSVEAIKSGNANPDTSLGKITNTINTTLKALGQPPISSGMGVNIGSVLNGALNAEVAYNLHAADALRATDPAAANRFATLDAQGNLVGGAANDIVTGQSGIKVPGLGELNLMDTMKIAYNPNIINTSVGANGEVKYGWNQTTGFKYVNGVLVPQTDQQAVNALHDSTKSSLGSLPLVGSKLDGKFSTSADEKSQLEKLGFTVKSVNSDGTIVAQFTSKTDKWADVKGKNDIFSGSGPGIGSGKTVTLIPQGNGSFQFAQGNNLYHIAFDSKGLGGLFQSKATGGTIALAGQYGFNQKLNTMISNSTISQLQAKVAADAAAAQAQRTNSMLKSSGMVPSAPQTPGALQGGAGPSAYATTSKGLQMVQRSGGGFNFTNNGKAISAAEYAQMSGTAFRSLLQTMATKGDSGAKAALGFVGNDYGYNPNAIGGNGSLYNSLVWGTGKSFTGAAGPTISGGQLKLPSGLKL